MAEKRLKHKLKVSWDQKANGENPRGYPVPSFGLDNDIKASLNSLDLEEGIHGNWNIDGTPEPEVVVNSKPVQDSVAVVEKEQIKIEKAAIDGITAIQDIPTTENTSESNPGPVKKAEDEAKGTQTAEDLVASVE